MKKTKIGISLRIMKAPNYDESRDAIGHDWAQFLEKIELVPIFIPNNLENTSKFLNDVEIEGLIISGGDNLGDYPQRDSTEKSLLEYGIKNKIPIFGVCRGMQIINDFFGGDVIKTSTQNHVDTSHNINIVNPLNYKIFDLNSIEVNSFHNNIINSDILGENLDPFAIADDKTTEGFYHKTFPIIGVMWHPERSQNENNKQLLKKVFHDTNFWKC